MVNRKDKRGVIGIIVFFVILFSILIFGFMAVMLISGLDLASDTVNPVLQEIGVVNGANVTSAVDSTVGVVNGFVQAMPWLIILAYVLALIFSIVFVVGYRGTQNPAFIGFYIAMILLLIFGSIIISNAYEDIYSGTDEIATRLQENTGMSYLIIYSPAILAIIAFITGIYLFASPRDGEGVEI